MIESLTLADLWGCRRPLALAPDDPLALAVSAMEKHQMSSVVVVMEERPIGIFTERDLLALIARGEYDPATPLRERMSVHPLTATSEQTFVDGYAKMSARGYRHLVLVDEDGRLNGVLSETDFAHVLGSEELLKARQIADLMTRDPVTLPPSASVAEAIRLMAEQRISSVVIAEAGHAVGILSERDVIRLAGSSLDLHATPIAERMSRPLHVIRANQPALDAGPRMRALGVRRLVVVDDSGHLVGILTRHDLLLDLREGYVHLLKRMVAVQGEALQEAEQTARELETLCAVIEQCALLGIIVADATQRIRFINGAARRMLGLAIRPAPTLSLPRLLQAIHADEETVAAWLADLGDQRGMSVELGHDLGQVRCRLKLVGAAVWDDAGACAGYLISLQEITAERAIRDDSGASVVSPVAKRGEPDHQGSRSDGLAPGSRDVLVPSAVMPASQTEDGDGSPTTRSPRLALLRRRRLQIEHELQDALAKGEFRLLYQPIIDMGTATIVGVESLLRWQHPLDGLLAPRDFIDAVERSSLARPVGRWVLEQSVIQAGEWSARGRVRVNINVSGPHILDGSLAHDIEDVLQRAGLDPALLGIEVRDQLLTSDREQMISALTRVRALGVVTALDNFGLAQSNPSALMRLPLDHVKIDKGFIRYMQGHPTDAAFVHSTIRIAHDLGMQVVAEGVETPDQLAYLSQAGCDLAQGFLLSRLVEAEAIGEMTASPDPPQQ
jgi:EAL domain-containing protein (putative c-di-GMP-specific phosphodiesterase class I)/CBS domain-containing protein